MLIPQALPENGQRAAHQWLGLSEFGFVEGEQPKLVQQISGVDTRPILVDGVNERNWSRRNDSST